jgi:hypothetical protein
MYILQFFAQNFISAAVGRDLSFDFTVHVSLPYSKIGRANVLYNYIHVSLWALFVLNVLLIIPVIFKTILMLMST